MHRYRVTLERVEPAQLAARKPEAARVEPAPLAASAPEAARVPPAQLAARAPEAARVEPAQPAARKPEAALTFDFESHDDVEAILARPTPSPSLDGADRLQLTLGLKLFSGVMLRHRDDPLFVAFEPHFAAFMKRLKGGGRGPGSRG